MLKFREIPGEVFFDALLKAKRSDGNECTFAPEEEGHEVFDDFLSALHLCLYDVYQEMEHESFFEDRIMEQIEVDFPEWYVRTKIRKFNSTLLKNGKKPLKLWKEHGCGTYEEVLASRGLIDFPA